MKPKITSNGSLSEKKRIFNEGVHINHMCLDERCNTHIIDLASRCYTWTVAAQRITLGNEILEFDAQKIMPFKESAYILFLNYILEFNSWFVFCANFQGATAWL